MIRVDKTERHNGETQRKGEVHIVCEKKSERRKEGQGQYPQEARCDASIMMRTRREALIPFPASLSTSSPSKPLGWN